VGEGAQMGALMHPPYPYFSAKKLATYPQTWEPKTRAYGLSFIGAVKAQFPRLARFDTVRVMLAGINAAIRAQIKSGMSKGYVAQWSREIYKVKSISKSKSEFIKSRY